MKEYTRNTSKHSYKKIRDYLLLIICFGVATIIYTESTREEPEERKVPSMFDYRGEVLNLNTISYDDNCRHEQPD